MPWYRQLHWQILIGLFLGLVWGVFALQVGLGGFTEDFIRPFGDMFIDALQLIAIPLVLASLIIGIANLNDVKKLSRMGGKTILIYIITSIFAITIGLLAVNLMTPWEVLPEDTRQQLMESYQDEVTGEEEAEDFLERSPLQFLVDIVPQNFFEAASDNANMLQVVFIAIILGIGLIYLEDKKAQPLIDVFQSLNDVIIKIVGFIIKLAPIGVFALIGAVIIDLGGEDLGHTLSLLGALGFYILVTIFGLIVHAIVIYGGLFKLYSDMSLWNFFRGVREAILVGFSTSSSLATLPVSMEVTEKNLGVKEDVTSFVIPVGATINMDGTSLYQAVTAVFIAQAMLIDLTFAQQLTIIITAVLASIGTAGVPAAGVIMLVIVLQAINVPVEGIALVLGVERILDMSRTAVNVIGNCAVAVAIGSMEGRLGEPDFGRISQKAALMKDKSKKSEE